MLCSLALPCLVLVPFQSSARGEAPPPIENLGIAIASFQTSEQLIAMAGAEPFGADMNGDGDAWDQVLVIHDPRAGSTTNLGLAISRYQVSGRRVAFTVSEADQDGTDLDGDGDASDDVLFVYDGASNTVRNLGYEADALCLEKGLLLFTVSELQAARDLNGDGDALDHVVNLLDLASGQVLDTGLSAPGPAGRSVLGTDGRRAAFLVDEALQGSTDLNGDGDALDTVLFVADPARGIVLNLGLAVFPEPYSDSFVWAADHLAFRAWEGGQSCDLNGDGDTDDLVVHVLRPNHRRADNLGLAAVDLQAGPDYFGFRVFELRQGATDLNGDGDFLDAVLHVRTLHPPRVLCTGLDPLVYRCTPGAVGFLAQEPQNGESDLNGDGDALDRVYHVLDVRSGEVTNVGLASTGFVQRPPHALIRVDEASQGGTDLDGDGEVGNSVAFLYDLRSGALQNLRLPILPFFEDPLMDLNQSDAVVYVWEDALGVDLNGNGSTLDQAPSLLHLGSGRLAYFGLSGSPGAPSRIFSMRRAFFAFVVSEMDEGIDLDGDGDLGDAVLHVARLQGSD